MACGAMAWWLLLLVSGVGVLPLPVGEFLMLEAAPIFGLPLVVCVGLSAGG